MVRWAISIAVRIHPYRKVDWCWVTQSIDYWRLLALCLILLLANSANFQLLEVNACTWLGWFLVMEAQIISCSRNRGTRSNELTLNSLLFLLVNLDILFVQVKFNFCFVAEFIGDGVVDLAISLLTKGEYAGVQRHCRPSSWRRYYLSVSWCQKLRRVWQRRCSWSRSSKLYAWFVNCADLG